MNRDMRRKKILLCLLVCVVIVPIANGFNFTQKLRNVQKITDTFELIISYQKTAKQVRPTDSTRLSKKFIRMITNLDFICRDHEEERIKKAYLGLLNTTLANTKLRSVDHENRLDELAKLYEPKYVQKAPIASDPAIEPEPTNQETLQETLEEATPSKSSLKEQIEEALQKDLMSRNEIIQLLTLKKLTKNVDKLTNNVNGIEPEIKKLFRKFQEIEELLKNETFEEQITRSLGIDLD